MGFGGKGKSKGKTTDGVQRGGGHLLPRTRITAEKFSGTCSAWKGKYGWVTPAEAIEHEKATKHNGSLFVGFEDLEGVTELRPGAPCEFHIWEDETGLGADEVVETGEPDPDFVDPAGKGSGKSSVGKGGGFAKGASKGWTAPSFPAKGMAKGAAKSWGGVVPPGKGGVKGSWGKTDFAFAAGKGFAPAGKGFAKGNAKGKSDGKAPKHKLPRTRISAEKFSGTVKEWKGKFGWIAPAEEIEHELASKNRGLLFFGLGDMEGADSLEAGTSVEFHLWEDSSGLGADEIVAV